MQKAQRGSSHWEVIARDPYSILVEERVRTLDNIENDGNIVPPKNYYNAVTRDTCRNLTATSRISNDFLSGTKCIRAYVECPSLLFKQYKKLGIDIYTEGMRLHPSVAIQLKKPWIWWHQPLKYHIIKADNNPSRLEKGATNCSIEWASIGINTLALGWICTDRTNSSN